MVDWYSVWHDDPRPSILIGPTNDVVAANRAWARAQGEPEDAADPFADLAPADLLRRARSSNAPVPGRLTLGGEITSIRARRADRDGSVLLIADPALNRFQTLVQEQRLLNERALNRIRTERLVVQEKVAAQAVDLRRSNQELEQFAYVASHDLQAPLRQIASFATLLEHSLAGRTSEDERRWLRFMVTSAMRMQRLVHSLLDHSRAQRAEVKLAPVDVAEVARDVLADLGQVIEEQGGSLRVEPGLPTVLADAHLLRPVLQNLVENAVKYRGEDPPRVRIHGESGYVSGGARAVGIIHVSDNGRGFDHRESERIFRMFYRAKEDGHGTGIGLAICATLVGKMGGSIEAQSEPGRGSTFTVTLPLSR